MQIINRIEKKYYRKLESDVPQMVQTAIKSSIKQEIHLDDILHKSFGR